MKTSLRQIFNRRFLVDLVVTIVLVALFSVAAGLWMGTRIAGTLDPRLAEIQKNIDSMRDAVSESRRLVSDLEKSTDRLFDEHQR